MARRIATILSLKDKMSPGLEKVSKNTKQVAKNAEKAKLKLGNMAISAADKIGGLASKAVKAGTAIAGLVAGAAVKTGLSEAMDLEGYKAQIETATKDTKKAGEIMDWCMQMANKTPFEGGEVVEAASKFESMGMSAKKWVTYAGDMAGATNKSMDQATEALIDAQTGELERLKEFGIKKADIVKKANQMFANEEVVNNKGQITNQKKFNEALLALMDDKFTGGMEKKAKTLRGTFSTITGVIKNALAGIMGVKSNGEVSKGSPLDLLKQKAQALANQLVKMQSDGTFDKIAKKVSSGVKKIISVVQKLVNFVKKNISVITKVAKVIGIITGIVFAVGKITKAVRKVKTVINTVKTAITAVNMVVMANPIVLIIAVIIAAIAAISYAVYKNWDKIKPVIDKIKAVVGKVIGVIKSIFMGLVSKIKSGAMAIFNVIKEKIDNIKEKFTKFKEVVVGIFKKIGSGIKNGVKGAFKWITDKIDKIKGAFSKVKNFFTGGGDGDSKDDTGHNANGTRYWRGGKTEVGEHGPEIVELPSGSKVYPATASRNMGGNTTVKVNVTVQGNVIGNKEYSDALGNEVAQKIILALGNT